MNILLTNSNISNFLYPILTLLVFGFYKIPVEFLFAFFTSSGSYSSLIEIFLTLTLTLILLLILPLFFSHSKMNLIQILYWVALTGTSSAFLSSLELFINFENLTPVLQFGVKEEWLPFIQLRLGVDGISIFFIILTTFLIPLCILASYKSITFSIKEFLILFVLLEILLIFVFTVLDIILFYIFFESVLIPMVLIIGVWGSRERRIRAAYIFFFYTLIGSLIMLSAIIYIYNKTGTSDYLSLLTVKFTETEQKWLWLAFFIAFATKVPIVPMHIWLPEAHVEAPTTGSVILAGILLKLGTYGCLRFLMTLFPFGTKYFLPLVYVLTLTSILYTSLIAIRQTDLKRIIAYASIAHMNLVILGLFTLTVDGIKGAILQMLSHGLVSSGLFLAVGVIYDQHHTRLIHKYSGLVFSMPLFTLAFFYLTLANIAFPTTSSFVGELLIFIELYKINSFVTLLSTSGVVLGAAYSLWLFNRVIFGNLNPNLDSSNDVSRREFMILFVLIIFVFIIGVWPEKLLDAMDSSVCNLVDEIHTKTATRKN